jgi:hypothetical protein
MNRYLFLTLVFSHICTYLLALAHSNKKSDVNSEEKSNSKHKSEPEIIDAETEPVTPELEEAMELLKDFEFRRIVQMFKLSKEYGGRVQLVKPRVASKKTQKPRDVQDERRAA